LDFKGRRRLGRVKSATKGVGMRLKEKAKGREGEKEKYLSLLHPFPSSLRFCKSNMLATIN